MALHLSIRLAYLTALWGPRTLCAGSGRVDACSDPDTQGRSSVQAEARILVGADSAVLWASSAALEILDMTLEELQGLPPGALSVDPDPEAAGRFRAAWAESGGSTVFARGTVRLLSGKLIRLRIYATPLPDGNIDLLLEPSSESTEEPPQTYTVGSVLSEWRAAERKLAAVAADSPDWNAVQAEIEHFRTVYKRVVRARDEGEPANG